MKDKVAKFFRILYHLKDKIAFFPSIIALGGCLFAYLMMYLETKGISKYLIETLPELVINNTETARTVLSTFIAGLISIMVFSFSMVMILLNQASSNFSPRLLPGLISNRKHQIILGIYIATILYCIFILVYIEPSGSKYQLPGFSVLLSIVLMVVSLAAFINFIHSISQEIQIENITNNISKLTCKKINYFLEQEKEKNFTFPDTTKWKEYICKSEGYYQSISIKIIKKIALENNCKIEVVSKRGNYCNEGDVLFKTEKKLDDNVIKQIYNAFDFSNDKMIEKNYLLAFKHLTEIAVKAMSPGINDPGTAINAIDYLSQLFSLRVQKQEKDYIFNDDKCIAVFHILHFNELLYQVMASLRTYCKHDVLLVKKLLSLLIKLKNYTKNSEKIDAINTEIENLLEDAKKSITNKNDYQKLVSYSSKH